MARTVVNNSQVPHLWANQSQDHAKGNGSISFTGSSIHSYAAEIGRLVDLPDGRRIALLVSRTWSPTTSSHQSAARGAVSHLPRFTVPNLHGYHPENLTYLADAYRASIKTLFGKRTEPSEWQYENARDQAIEATRYAQTFSLPNPELYPETDLEAVKAFHNTPDKAAKKALRDARHAADRAEREAREAAARAAREAAQAQAIADWRAGVRYSLPHDAQYDASGGALIRINGDTLETSRGAQVPLAHAVKVFHRVAQCRAAGKSWHRNGDTIRVGNFQVDSIDPDGSFVAGCHRFTWPEIENAARLAGVLMAVAA
jgi:hypothetical protein